MLRFFDKFGPMITQIKAYKVKHLQGRKFADKIDAICDFGPLNHNCAKNSGQKYSYFIKFCLKESYCLTFLWTVNVLMLVLGKILMNRFSI